MSPGAPTLTRGYEGRSLHRHRSAQWIYAGLGGGVRTLVSLEIKCFAQAFSYQPPYTTSTSTRSHTRCRASNSRGISRDEGPCWRCSRRPRGET